MAIPKWLFPLLQAEFRTARIANCDTSNYGYFCMTCMGNALREVDYKRDHRDHEILRAVKASHHFAVRVEDVKEKLCCKDIAEFSVNHNWIFFLKSRVKPSSLEDEGPKNKRRRTMESVRRCVECSWRLPEGDTCSRYCSLGCKFTRNDTYIQPNEEEGRNEEYAMMDGATNGNKVEFAPKTKFSFRKRSRKGIPVRSPFF